MPDKERDLPSFNKKKGFIEISWLWENFINPLKIWILDKLKVFSTVFVYETNQSL